MKYVDKQCPQFATTGAWSARLSHTEAEAVWTLTLFLHSLCTFQASVNVVGRALINTILRKLQSAGHSCKGTVQILPRPVLCHTNQSLKERRSAFISQTMGGAKTETPACFRTSVSGRGWASAATSPSSGTAGRASIATSNT